MTEKMTPTVIRDAKQFGRVLRLLRVILGLTRMDVANLCHVSPPLITLREKGQRGLNVDQAATVLAHFGYVLIVMSTSDAAQLPRLTGDTLEALTAGAPHAFSAPPS